MTFAKRTFFAALMVCAAVALGETATTDTANPGADAASKSASTKKTTKKKTRKAKRKAKKAEPTAETEPQAAVQAPAQPTAAAPAPAPAPAPAASAPSASLVGEKTVTRERTAEPDPRVDEAIRKAEEAARRAEAAERRAELAGQSRSHAAPAPVVISPPAAVPVDRDNRDHERTIARLEDRLNRAEEAARRAESEKVVTRDRNDGRHEEAIRRAEEAAKAVEEERKKLAEERAQAQQKVVTRDHNDSRSADETRRSDESTQRLEEERKKLAEERAQLLQERERLSAGLRDEQSRGESSSAPADAGLAQERRRFEQLEDERKQKEAKTDEEREKLAQERRERDERRVKEAEELAKESSEKRKEAEEKVAQAEKDKTDAESSTSGPGLFGTIPTSRTHDRLGVYASLWGDPFPSTVGVNLAYNATDYFRVNAGVGGNNDQTRRIETVGFGVKALVPGWEITPVVGMHVAFSRSGGSRSVGGFSPGGANLYGTAGLDWQTGLGLNFAAGYAAPLDRPRLGNLFVNAGIFL